MHQTVCPAIKIEIHIATIGVKEISGRYEIELRIRDGTVASDVNSYLDFPTRNYLSLRAAEYQVVRPGAI